MALDVLLIVIGSICIITGIIGCMLPVLPGPILSYAGLLVLQFSSAHPFTIQFLFIYALLTIITGILDYVIPIYGTKKLEGSKYGIWGCTAGLILGIFLLFPFGIIIGPMVGAFAGELISGKTADRAFKSALGSLLGFLASMGLKLILCLSMAYHFALQIIKYF
jgi:uncharacterized protein YqgC (DUF456 family)